MFREGRRASDGLVAQGILNNADHPLNAGVAFNSQRLHEACKAKGVLELHLLQKEAAQLVTQYQTNVPQDELMTRQIQHSHFVVQPVNIDLPAALYQCSLKQSAAASEFYNNKQAGDLASVTPFLGLFGKETAPQLQQKPPLQQMMQHRILQQKRQILQKQGALENTLSRRQIMRQVSYKLAQQAQILPPLPLPLSENETEDLLAFQTIVENPAGAGSPTPSASGSPKMMKTTHISSGATSPQPMSLPAPDCNQWNTLPNSMQACQISEGSQHDTWTHTAPPLYQVYFNYSSN